MYFLMLNLRTNKGFSYKQFYKRFNFDIRLINDTLTTLKNNKLLKILKSNICLTYQGMMILDSIVIDLIRSIEKLNIIK